MHFFSKKLMNPEKLAQLQASVRIGGKGTPRRKVKKVSHTSGGDDKKLQSALKKLNVQAIGGIEEVNMFKTDGHVIHFASPKVHASIASNTFVIYGEGQNKELTELIPGIIPQMGQEALAEIRKMAEAYQKTGGKLEVPKEDDEVPTLVESFE